MRTSRWYRTPIISPKGDLVKDSPKETNKRHLRGVQSMLRLMYLVVCGLWFYLKTRCYLFEVLTHY